MKLLFTALASLTVLSTGCSHQTMFYGHSSSALSSSHCPPGHRWSDGKCHDQGKGHDPAKHSK